MARPDPAGTVRAMRTTGASIPGWDAREEVMDETLEEMAERLQGYWEQHGEDTGVVQRWALEDMRALLTRILGDQS